MRPPRPDDAVVVEGNHYFPRESLKEQFFRPADKHSFCPWKGVASYYTLSVGGSENRNAAWYYPDPLPQARMVAGRVAFWHGVVVEP